MRPPSAATRPTTRRSTAARPTSSAARGTLWTSQAYLKASNAGAGDTFGWSVAIDGDAIVVGARLEDGSATGVDGVERRRGTRQRRGVPVPARRHGLGARGLSQGQQHGDLRQLRSERRHLRRHDRGHGDRRRQQHRRRPGQQQRERERRGLRDPLTHPAEPRQTLRGLGAVLVGTMPAKAGLERSLLWVGSRPLRAGGGVPWPRAIPAVRSVSSASGSFCCARSQRAAAKAAARATTRAAVRAWPGPAAQEARPQVRAGAPAAGGNGNAGTGTATAGTGGASGASGAGATAGTSAPDAGPAQPPPATCGDAARAYTVASSQLDASLVPEMPAQSWGGAGPRTPVAVDPETGKVYVGFTRAEGASRSVVIAAEGSAPADVITVADAVIGGVAVTSDGVAALLFDPNSDVDMRMWTAVARFGADGSETFRTDLFRSPNLDDEGTKGAPSTGRLGYVPDSDELVAYFGHTQRYDDGVRHQGGYLATLSAAGAQDVINPWFGSHNLDQRLLIDGARVAVLGLGDAFPKGIFFSYIEQARTNVIYRLAADGVGSTNGKLGGMVAFGDQIISPFVTNRSIAQDLDAGPWPDTDEAISMQIREAAAAGTDLGLLAIPKASLPDGDVTPIWLDAAVASGASLGSLKSDALRHGRPDPDRLGREHRRPPQPDVDVLHDGRRPRGRRVPGEDAAAGDACVHAGRRHRDQAGRHASSGPTCRAAGCRS